MVRSPLFGPRTPVTTRSTSKGEISPQTFSFHHQITNDKNYTKKPNLSNIYSIPGGAEFPENSLWMRVQHPFLPKNRGLQTVQHHFVSLLAQLTEVWELLSVHIIQTWKQYFNFHASLIVHPVTQQNPKHFEKICQKVELQLHLMFNPHVGIKNVQIKSKNNFSRLNLFWNLLPLKKIVSPPMPMLPAWWGSSLQLNTFLV